MQDRYQWKPGFSGKGVACSVVAELIERIKDKNGEASPKAFVDASRPKNAPTHKMLPWNNTEAAEKWREHLARRIIHSVEIVRVNDTGEKKREIAYVSVKKPFQPGAGYQSTVDAMANPTSRQIVLETAWNILQGWHKRYGRLTEYANIAREIERIQGEGGAAAV